MKNKILEAVSDMGKKVRFVTKPRHYESINGDWLQGVSSVSSIVPKDWLSAWGAKEAVKFLGYSDYEGDTERAKQVLSDIQMLTPVEWIKFLKEAKGASGRKSKTALVDGKLGHAWLESFVKAKIGKTALPALPEGSLKRPIEQFLEWEKDAVQEWVLSEALVAYPEKGYAGTLDSVAVLKNGRLALPDFKFASHISEDYFLQTAGYAHTFEPYGIKFDDRIIIRLPKTLEKEEWNEKEHKYYMVPNNIEIFFVDTELGYDVEIFLHALPLKQWINAIEKRKGK